MAGWPLLLLAVVVPGQLWGLFAASSDINVQVCSPNASLFIVSPPDGTSTNDSSVVVSGYGAESVSVAAYRNNVNVGTVTTGGDGSYSLSVPLTVGSNGIHTRVTNACGHGTDSNAITVTRLAPPTPPANNPPPANFSPQPQPQPQPQPPPSNRPDAVDDQLDAPSMNKEPGRPPDISLPRDGLVTDNPTILVRGKGQPGSRLWLTRNGQRLAEVLADDAGQFAATIPLTPGRNVIVVIAETEAGETRSEPVTVTYQPSQPAATSQTPPKWPSPTFSFVVAPVLLAATIGLIIGRHHHKWQMRKNFPPNHITHDVKK